MPEKLDQHDIKDLRQRAWENIRMSYDQVVEYLGVTRMTLWRWEHGKARPSQLAQRQLRRLHKKTEVRNNEVSRSTPPSKPPDHGQKMV